MNIKYKHKKIFAAVLLTILFILLFSVPSAAKNNIALECKIDSVCDGTGEMLVDKDENYHTKWHAADGANHSEEPHWIILDFETEKTFDLIRLVKASQGAEDFGRIELNAGGFRFEISSDKENWVEILEVADNGEKDICDSYFSPVTARYLKLIVTNPEQDENSNENQAVRLYDLKVFEYIPLIEEYENENGEEISDIEASAVPSSSIAVTPNTADSLLYPLFFLLFLLSAALFVIIQIFSSQRIR